MIPLRAITTAILLTASLQTLASTLSGVTITGIRMYSDGNNAVLEASIQSTGQDLNTILNCAGSAVTVINTQTQTQTAIVSYWAAGAPNTWTTTWANMLMSAQAQGRKVDFLLVDGAGYCSTYAGRLQNGIKIRDDLIP